MHHGVCKRSLDRDMHASVLCVYECVRGCACERLALDALLHTSTIGSRRGLTVGLSSTVCPAAAKKNTSTSFTCFTSSITKSSVPILFRR
jgi:hypothetical protein